jgi:hypothetical protein
MNKISDFFIKRKIENFTRMNNDKNLNKKEERPQEEIQEDIINPLFIEEQEKKKDNQI